MRTRAYLTQANDIVRVVKLSEDLVAQTPFNQQRGAATRDASFLNIGTMHCEQ